LTALRGERIKAVMAFGLEEGVADLAELVGDEVDSLDVEADWGVEHWAEDGEILGAEALSDQGLHGLDHAVILLPGG
jgi:hypothetical protein